MVPIAPPPRSFISTLFNCGKTPEDQNTSVQNTEINPPKSADLYRCNKEHVITAFTVASITLVFVLAGSGIATALPGSNDTNETSTVPRNLAISALPFMFFACILYNYNRISNEKQNQSENIFLKHDSEHLLKM